MSHGIEADDTMFSSKIAPWHLLGTALSAPPAAKEAIALAGLDWTIQKREMFIDIDGGAKIVPNKWAVVREQDDKILGTVGPDYTILQNYEAFDFFDKFVEDGVAVYETAGSLHGGKKVWILARLKGDIEVGKDDVVTKYVLLTTAHDGTGAVIVKITPVRVVCANTLSAALHGGKLDRKNGNQFSIRHTKTVSERTRTSINLLKAINQRYDKIAKVWAAMASFQMPAHEISRYVETVFPNPENIVVTKRKESLRANVTKYITSGTGQSLDSSMGTLWGAYNGITEMLTHEVSTRKGNDLHKHCDQLWSGKIAETNDKAFVAAIQFMKKAGVSIDL